MAPPTAEQLLAEMTDTTAAIHATEHRLDDLRAARVALWQQARALDPPVPHRQLAGASSVSEEAVLKALRKARAAEQAVG